MNELPKDLSFLLLHAVVVVSVASLSVCMCVSKCVILSRVCMCMSKCVILSGVCVCVFGSSLS